ncbi:MAG TPA: RNA polymerase sigma factor [Cytophagaceae bacterium]|jgi:RNA polymerase sigma factor (sigma-70 family)|nr:RNA polymerase sigma factor [Cytophagaceae bacterium]
MTAIEFNDLVYSASKSLKIPAFKFTHNYNDARDLIQDTLLKALGNRDKFKEGSNIKAWLYIIMRNTFISQYHKIDKRSKLIDPIDEDYIFIGSGAVSQNLGTSNIASKEINCAIDNLDKTFRVPFMMHYEGFKYNEIAEHLNIPIGDSKKPDSHGKKDTDGIIVEYKY